MCDLETMSNVGNSVICSVGLVHCNIITGETGDTFYRVIDIQEQIDDGFNINADTLYWWLSQSDGARQGIIGKGQPTLTRVCSSIIKWLNSLGNPKKFRLWGNGASFDNAILRTAFANKGFEFPIDFWNDRDMRTVVGYCPDEMVRNWKIKNQRIGTYHNALDDAKYQVKLCSYIHKELGVKEIY